MSFAWNITFWTILLCFHSQVTGNDIFSKEGDEKLIQWIVDPPPGDQIVYVIHPSGESLYTALGTLIVHGTGSNAKRVRNTGNTNTNTGHVEFTLNDVNVNDAGEYKTQFKPPSGIGNVKPVGAILNVYVQPSKPVITFKSAPVLGQIMSLQCNSTSSSKPEGKLTMKYKWYINNADLPNDSRYNTTGSQLQVKSIQKSDKDSTFTCKGYENITLLSEASDGHTPDVEFGPDTVTLSPNIARYEKVENESIEAIACTADCNPPCTFHWKVNGSTIGEPSITLTLNNIQRGQAGIYWCKVTNKHGMNDSQRVTVTVKYGPRKVTLSPDTSRYALVEDIDNTLGPITCSADCNPPCTYQWSHNGTVIRSSAVLELTGADRHDDGIYTCNASNSYGNKVSAQVRLVVEYKPENIKLEPNNQSYVRLESETLGPIICSAICKPSCAYNWTVNNVVIHQGIVFNISNINRIQSGTYTCLASNMHGNIKSNGINIDVQYPPESTTIMTKGNVKENDMLSVVCTTQSNPASTIHILLEGGDGRRIVHEATSTLTVNYTKPADCLDTGNYFCEARNKYGNSVSNKTGINVFCFPRPVAGIHPENIVSIGDKKILNITGTLIAYPKPDITWIFRKNGTNSSKLIGNGTDGIDIYMSSSYVYYSFQIMKSNIEVSDFGDYVLNASNPHGTGLIVYHVTSKRSPDPPYNLSVICETTEAKIEWTSNFNGGVTQHFIINIEKPNHENATHTVSDKGMNEKHELAVLNLNPNTRYNFVVNATNQIGSFVKPPSKFCTTNDEPSGPGALIGGVVGSIAFILLIVVMILAAVFLLKKRRSKKDESTELMNRRGVPLQDDPDDGMKRNILYESAGPFLERQNDSSADCHYAAVDKSTTKHNNSADVYSVVEKKGKKQKPDVGKSKPKGKKTKANEKPREEIYENFGGNFEDEYAYVKPAAAGQEGEVAEREAPSRRKNKEGLVYIDVVIGNAGKNKLNGIHGIEKRVDYVDIDFNRPADPLPSDDEEDEDNQEKNNAEKERAGEC